MPYIMMIIGLLAMCVPDDAGVLRTIVQGGFGIISFWIGISILLEKNG